MSSVFCYHISRGVLLSKITTIKAREIIDSRGDPTVEVDIALDGGGVTSANVGSGTSIGSYEMHELRDGDLGRLRGRGVTRVVENVNHYLAPQIIGMEFNNQKVFDQYIVGLDGTPSLEHYGANGILCLSYAYAMAEADRQKQPAYVSFRMLREDLDPSAKLEIPKPMINIFNGGKLAAFSTDAQEFNIVIKNASSFRQALQVGADIYHAVGTILQKSGFGKQVGDEGGYSVPNATTDQGMSLIVEGTQLAGYKAEDMALCWMWQRIICTPMRDCIIFLITMVMYRHNI
jgi:enolase